MKVTFKSSFAADANCAPQLILRESEVDRRAKLADAQMSKADKMMRDHEATIASDRAKVVSAVPAVPQYFEKENDTAAPSKEDPSVRTAKPLQPLHNIYDRREKLLARLLNHRIGATE